MKGIETISIVGTGNVAFHLGNAFREVGIQINSVYGRNTLEAQKLALSWDCVVESDLACIEADLVLLCISDDAIAETVTKLNSTVSIAYTSGAVNLLDLPLDRNIGVFYPLQSFSKSRKVNIFEVPFLIEARDSNFSQELFELAWKLSRKVTTASSEQRLHYHIAAVFVNNFANHLFTLAKEHTESHDLNWQFLLPLIEETVEKIKEMDPKDAQTGPAVRHDLKTIQSHLDHLEGVQKEIYSLITKSISETKHDQL